MREWEEKQTKRQYANKTAALKKTNLKPAYLVRYADDWVLITNTKSNAENGKNGLKNSLTQN